MNRPPQMGPCACQVGSFSMTRGPLEPMQQRCSRRGEPIETAIHVALRGGPGFDLDGEIRRDYTEFLMAEARKARDTTGTTAAIVDWLTHSQHVRTDFLSSSTESLRGDLLDRAHVTYHRTARTEVRETSASGG